MPSQSPPVWHRQHHHGRRCQYYCSNRVCFKRWSNRLASVAKPAAAAMLLLCWEARIVGRTDISSANKTIIELTTSVANRDCVLVWSAASYYAVHVNK